MESNVFPKPKVRQELEKYIIVKLYTDRGEIGKKNLKLRDDRFKSNDLPLYVLLTPDGEEIDRRKGLQSVDAFAEFLRDGLKAANTGRPAE